jgi:Fur family zinc uptake transcriptional regulator
MLCARARHQHAQPTGPALASAARGCLEAAGEQWTPLRAEVFSALADTGGPASAYLVAEAASRRLGRRIAANSVYRILDLFVGAHIATRIESRNAYIVNEHPGCAHDCIFLVCDTCDAIAHIDDDGLTTSLRLAAKAGGFRPARPVIEVRGRCAACA